MTFVLVLAMLIFLFATGPNGMGSRHGRRSEFVALVVQGRIWERN